MKLDTQRGANFLDMLGLPDVFTEKELENGIISQLLELYLMLDEKSDIRVAQYYTELPSKEVLADRLQRAIAIAREHQSENRKID